MKSTLKLVFEMLNLILVVTAGIIATVFVAKTCLKNYSTTERTLSHAGVDNPFYTGCDKSKLCFGSPPRCLEDGSCRAAVSITVEDNKYTFDLIGTTEPSFVAVGLSQDKIMGNDSSMECQQICGQVTAHTSWTSARGYPYSTREGVPQDIIQINNASYADGVLRCTFIRNTLSTVKEINFNLARDRYYLHISAGSLELNGVGFHETVFDWSDTILSLSTIDQLTDTSRVLLKLHSILMIIAWMGTTSVGILMARYFRQTWVGKTQGGKDLWFAWHQYLMMITWVLTIIAFVIIVVQVGGWADTGGNPHTIIGLTTVILCFLQPFGALLKQKTDMSKRKMFDWIHWIFGHAAHILGIISMFFGVYLRKSQLPGWTKYILIIFVTFHLTIHFTLSMAKIINDKQTNDALINTSNIISQNGNKNSDASYSRFRKTLLVLYIIITLWCILALIVLVVLTNNI